MVKLYYGVMPLYLPLAERRQAMKLTDKCYRNQVFKKVSFYNGGLAIWWTKKTFERCDFEDCDFTGIIARGCRFIDCVFKRGKLQHFYMGSTTLVIRRKTVYRNCTFERVKLRNFGIADFFMIVHSSTVISSLPLLPPHLPIAILLEKFPTVCSAGLNIKDIIT